MHTETTEIRNAFKQSLTVRSTVKASVICDAREVYRSQLMNVNARDAIKTSQVHACTSSNTDVWKVCTIAMVVTGNEASRYTLYRMNQIASLQSK